MSVDHVVLAVPDLDAAVRELGEQGVVCGPGGSHPAHGTHNALARIGPTMFLEVLAADPSVEPSRRSDRGAVIASVERPTVHELILLEPESVQMEGVRRGYEVDEPIPGRRVRDDGQEVAWVLTRWRTRGGLPLPDLIRWKTDHPIEGLPASHVRGRVSWSHPDVDEVLTALATVGADDVEGTRGKPRLRLALVDATTGAPIAAFDGHEPL